MTYERLADFVQNRMRMSHVYQPVMLMELLRGGGRRSTKEIARSILAHDESQVDVHLILRRNGDVEDPARGVFHVTPGMGAYL